LPFQQGLNSFIPCLVTGDLGNPIFSVRFWYASTARAPVPMPEATMDEDKFLPAWKNKVGRTG
jgi:hypothetical protein